MAKDYGWKTGSWCQIDQKVPANSGWIVDDKGNGYLVDDCEDGYVFWFIDADGGKAREVRWIEIAGGLVGDGEQTRWRKARPLEAMLLAEVFSVRLRPQNEIVTLCGSTRFKAEFEKANHDLTLEGAIVLAPGVFDAEEADKEALDTLHLDKIRMSSRVVVVNPGCYIGESTAREIAFARLVDKAITFTDSGEDGIPADTKIHAYDAGTGRGAEPDNLLTAICGYARTPAQLAAASVQGPCPSCLQIASAMASLGAGIAATKITKGEQ